MDTAFEFVVKNGGIDTEEDYRYHAIEGQCSVNRKDRHVVTIDDYDDGAPLLACLLVAATWARPPLPEWL